MRRIHFTLVWLMLVAIRGGAQNSLPERVKQAQALEEAGRFAEARDRFSEMLRETETAAPNSPDVAALMNNLATVEADLGNYLDAERLYREALAIFKQTRGENDPQTVGAMLSLGGLYIETARPVQAKPLLERADEISNAFGSDHPLAGEISEAIGILLIGTHKYEQAEAPLRKALLNYEKRFGAGGLNAAYVLNELARAEIGAGRNAEALANAERSFAILQALPPPAPRPALVKALNILAAAYFRADRIDEAESLFKKAIATAEQLYGPDHPVVAYSLRNYATLLERMNRRREAKKLERRSAFILARSTAVNRQAYTIDVSSFVSKD